VADDPQKLMLQATEAKERGLSPEQQALRDAVDHRNAVMQERGVRPKDGICFAKSKKERA
jgi:hypothetical protein